MFWGLVLEPAKKYTQRVEQSFHISQASLELKSADLEPIQIVVEWEGASYILATLSKKNNIFQVPLDLNFETGDQISFRTIGKGRVHLSGYHIMDEDDLGGLMQGDEEEDESDVEEETGAQNEVQTSGKRKKSLNKTNESKKQKFDTTNEEQDEDEDSDDSDDDSIGDTTGFDNTTMGDSTMFDMYDEDDDDEEDSDELEEESDDEDDDEEDDEEEEEESEEEITPTPKSEKKKEKQQNVNASVNGISSSKKDKKNKLKSEGSPAKENATPKKDKLSPKKEVKTPKQGDSQKKTPKNENKTPKQDGKSPKTPSTPGTKRVLEGGVIIEELQVGEGQVAKPGKMAQVYYSGRLKANNKLFDSATQGPGFKFRLGKGEVIKGWDIGVNGMKVGGKRKITIPSTLAYGSKGNPPVIPPNATLVFEVELKGIS